MFSLKVSSSYISDSPGAAYGDLVLSPESNNISPIINFVPYSSADFVETAIATDLNINGDRLFFSSDAENILMIAIDENNYTLGEEELQANQFIYNNGVVEVRIDSFNPNSIVTYVGTKKVQVDGDSCTDYICLGSNPVLSKWNAFGDFNISRSFNSEPTANFSFKDCRQNENYINSALCNDTELVIERVKWVVSGLTITRIKDSENIVVTVALKHYLASRGNPGKSPLDKKLLKKKKTSRNSYQRSRKLSEYAQAAGVNLSGGNDTVRTPRSTGSEDTTTLRELLQSRAIKNHQFLFYNNDGVELRDWYNTRVHVISENDVIGDVSYSNNGHGSKVDGIKLHTEFRNLKVQLDFDQDAADGNVGITQRWVFENCRDLEDLYSPREDKGFYFTQPDPETLRNVGLNFDAGGRQKKATLINYYNGTATSEIKIEAGFAYSSAEIYEIHITEQGNFILKLKSLINPNSHWEETANTTTNYIFDEDGYRTSKQTTGQELARLQQESHKLEAITLKARAIQNSTDLIPDASLMAQSEAYQFKYQLPINDVTNYFLERHSKYFADTIQSADPCNKEQVPSKFISLMNRASQSQIIAPNPKSTEEFTYPLITTGKQLFEFEQTTVTNSTEPFQFEQRSSSTSAEGEYLKNAIALGTVTQHDGKPGIASKLNRELDLNDTSTNNNYDRYRDSNYYISSTRVEDSGKINEGSKSYPDVDNPFEVAAIATTELSIINSQNSQTLDLNICWRQGVEEGDFALFDGHLWKIFGIQDNREITHEGYKSTSFTLKLGRFSVSPVRLENRTDCSQGSAINFGETVVEEDIISL